MANGIISRKAVAADQGKLTGLQHAAYQANREILGVEPLPLLVDYGTILREMSVWLFERGTFLAGALILKPEPDHLLIWSVASHHDARGLRLGSDMMFFAEDEARRQNLSQTRLYTGSRLVERIGWYERLGYRIDRVEELPDCQITHMLKQLQPRGSAG